MTNPQLSHQRNWMNWNRENRLLGRFQGAQKPEKAKARHGAPWVRNPLGKTLADVGAAKDPNQQREWAEHMEKAKAYVKRIREALDSGEKLEEGLDEWENIGTLLDILNKPEATYEGLVGIVDSGLEAFLDPATRSRVVLARGAIEQNINVQRVLRPTMEDEKKISKGHGYSEMIPQEALDRIRMVADQARNEIQEVLAERLEKQLEQVRAEADRLMGKWEKELAPQTPRLIREALEGAQNAINAKIRSSAFSELPTDEGMARLKGWMREFESSSKAGIQDIKELDSRLAYAVEHRKEIGEGLDRKETKMRQLITIANSAQNLAILKSALDFEKAKIASQADALALGKCESAGKWLKRMEHPTPEEKNNYKDLEELKGLSAEELLARNSEATMAAQKLEAPEKCGKARDAMKAIAGAVNMGEALDRLTEAVGPEHIEYVSSKKFESKYRKYTSTGYMVFAIKGDQWRIIIDGDKIKREDNADFIKEQLTHELRHLEFEGDKGLEASWHQAFLESLDPKSWSAIKGSFVSRYPNKTPSDYKGDKTQFEPSDWSEADVLSELYAMAPDWAFMGEAESMASKAVRIAEFNRSEDLKKEWANAFPPESDLEQWATIKEAAQKAFPHRVDALSDPLNEWENSKVMAELYSLTQQEWDEKPSLAEALATAGVFSGILGKALDKNANRNYGESVEERILGFEGDAKEKKRDEEEEKGQKKSKAELQSKTKGLIKKIEDYEKSPYIGDVAGGKGLLSEMKRYAKKLEGRLDELEHSGRLEVAEKLIKAIEDDLEKEGGSIKSELLKVSEHAANDERNPLRAFWDNTHIYSIHAFVDVYGHVKDYFERWMKKNHGIHKANLGKQLFDGIHEGLTLEAGSFQSDAWRDVIEGWEKRIKSKDVATHRKYLQEMAESGSVDKALVCAIVNVMCEKGTMNWVDPYFWTCLNHLHTEVGGKLDKDDMLLYTNEEYLHEKLKIAMGAKEVFAKKGAFNDKFRTNTNAYEGKKREYESGILTAAGKIGPRLHKMLMLGKMGKKAPVIVDPAEYEMMIELAIHNGLYSPQNAMFYLLSGMACGILNPNTGAKLAKLWNEYPVMNYFTASDVAPHLSSTENIKEFVKNNFKEEYEMGKISSGKSKFRSFYWGTMVNHGAVYRRISKTAKPGGGKWDHDWSESFAMCGDVASFSKILKSAASDPTENTMPPNIYAGFLQWFELNEHPSKKHLVDRISGYFAFKSIMSGAAYGTEKGYVRDSNIQMGIPAGEADSTNHPKESTSWVSDTMNNMIMHIPNLGPLFQLATDQKAAIGNPVGHLQAIKTLLLSLIPGEADWIDSSLVNLDKFYDNIGLIVAKVLEGQSAESLVSAIHHGLPNQGH